MRSKLVTMFLTFIVMIAITPFIFDKLMNSRFNKMLDNLRKEGYQIKEIENKSSYLKTDRVFDVVVPLEDENIKDVKLRVETIFKNLPVTDVRFLGVVKEIDFKDDNLDKINEFIKNKIKFLVITPNFKTYKYKVFDNKIEIENNELSFSGINGIYFYPNKGEVKAADVVFKDKISNYYMEVKNFVNKFERDRGVTQHLTFDGYMDVGGKVAINGVDINSFTLLDKKISNDIKVRFKTLNIFNQVAMNDFSADFKVNDLDYKALESEPKKAIEEGFSASLNAKLKKILVSSKNIGFIDLTSKLKILPTKNVDKLIKDKNLSFVDLDLNLKTSKQIAAALSMIDGTLAMLFSFADVNNDKVLLDLKFKRGELIINGQKVGN